MSKNFISVYTVPNCSWLLQPCMQKQSKPPVKYIVPESNTAVPLTCSGARGEAESDKIGRSSGVLCTNFTLLNLKPEDASHQPKPL